MAEQATTFGEWVRERRRAHMLTQAALAEKAGYSAVTIRHIEAGRLKPSREVIERLMQVFEVGEASLAELRRLGARAGKPTAPAQPISGADFQLGHVPRAAYPIIGRQAALEQMRRTVLNGGQALVTLIGPPGIGKTRLAIALVEEIHSYWSDGVIWLSMDSLTQPGQVVPLLIQACRKQFQSPDSYDTWLEWLVEQQILFLLDNMEHVAEAGAALNDIIQAADKCTWVVTSRIALNLYGEQLVPLGPLETPAQAPLSQEQFEQQPATALFIERVRNFSPEVVIQPSQYATISAICRHLEGIPLALELAAARCRVLGFKMLLEQLQDRYALLTAAPVNWRPRQQSLRSAVEWSYNLLSAEQQRLFRLCGIFRGGWSLAAIQVVGAPGGGLAAVEVIDRLDTLVQHSLVSRTATTGGPRYRMLETLREFALERLGQADEYALAMGRLAAYLKDLYTQPRRDRYAEWLDELEIEQGNLTTAVEWLLANSRPAPVLEVFNHALGFWIIRGDPKQAMGWIDQILEQAARLDRNTHAAALLNKALLLHRYGQSKAGLALIELALELIEDHTAAIYANALEQKAALSRSVGETSEIRALLLQALQIAENTTDDERKGHICTNLALYLQDIGEAEQSKAYLHRAKNLYRSAGALIYESVALLNLGSAHLALGEHGDAERYLKQALESRRQLRLFNGAALCLIYLAELAIVRNDIQQAGEYLQEAEVVAPMMSYHPYVYIHSKLVAAQLAFSTGSRHEGWSAASQGLCKISGHRQFGLAISLLAVASQQAAVNNDWDTTLRWFAALQHITNGSYHSAKHLARIVINQLVEHTPWTRHIEPQRLALIEREGAALTLEQAIDEALDYGRTQVQQSVEDALPQG